MIIRYHLDPLELLKLWVLKLDADPRLKHWTWILASLSIVGVVLNVWKNPICFYIWAGTNFTWMLVDYRKGLYSQALLFFVYFLLAIWGMASW